MNVISYHVSRVAALTAVAASPVFTPQLAARGAADTSVQPVFVSPTVEETVSALTAPAFGGRLTGSAGNEQARNWLVEQLDALGLEPLPGNVSLIETYEQPVLVADAPPSLTVRPSGHDSVRFQPGLDFDVLIRQGTMIAGRIEAELVAATPDLLTEDWIARHRTNALLFAAESFGRAAENQSIMRMLFSPESAPAALIIGSPQQLDTVPRSLFLTGDTFPQGRPMLVQTTHETAVQLANHEGDMLVITASNRVEVREVSNVAGRLPGAPDTQPVVLSAHFDGPGRVNSARYYPGAVDNAAGVATVLETTGRIAAEVEAGLTPGDRRTGRSASDAPIWIVFFNGEEQGLYGSQAFARRSANSGGDRGSRRRRSRAVGFAVASDAKHRRLLEGDVDPAKASGAPKRPNAVDGSVD